MVQQLGLTGQRMPLRGVPVVGIGAVETAFLKRQLVAVAQEIRAAGMRESREMLVLGFRVMSVGERPEALFASRLSVPHAIEFNHQHVHNAPSCTFAN